MKWPQDIKAQESEKREPTKELALEVGIAIAVNAILAALLTALLCLLGAGFLGFFPKFLKTFWYLFILFGGPFCLDALLTIIMKEPPSMESSMGIYYGTLLVAWILHGLHIFTGGYALPIIAAFLISFFAWKALRDRL